MAQRRMVSVKIIDSAKFIKMPVSCQSLYFHLIARADDDGVVEAFNVMRMVGASEDDLKVLVAKQFATVLNEDLVTFINDWNEHNLIRSDRKIDSIYQDLLVHVIGDIELKQRKERADRRKNIELPAPIEQKDDIGTSQGQPSDSIGKGSVGEFSEVEGNNKTYSDNKYLDIAIKEFIEYRNTTAKKKTDKMSDIAIKKLVNKLHKDFNTDEERIKTLEESILNGWKGIFPLKSNNKQLQPKPQPQYTGFNDYYESED